MVANCTDSIATTLGEVRVFNSYATYERSLEHCNQMNGSLVPTSNQSLIDRISEELVTCLTRKGILLLRGSRRWLVGLTTHNGQGNWSDGQAYVASVQAGLFVDRPFEDAACGLAYLHPAEKKLYASKFCDYRRGYLCLVANETSISPTAAAATASADAGLGDEEHPSVWKLTLLVLVLVVVSSGFLAVLMWIRVCRKQQQQQQQQLAMKSKEEAAESSQLPAITAV